ncbi:hypothetical protein QR685DRAFT_53087 [Neurospora intermedia]|uniref:Secreted protein n=1 Tax=Neurospora intermedia TaxID=5142 RepID=A0ABR3DUJ8_NEUIN
MAVFFFFSFFFLFLPPLKMTKKKDSSDNGGNRRVRQVLGIIWPSVLCSHDSRSHSPSSSNARTSPRRHRRRWLVGPRVQKATAGKTGVWPPPIITPIHPIHGTPCHLPDGFWGHAEQGSRFGCHTPPNGT